MYMLRRSLLVLMAASSFIFGIATRSWIDIPLIAAYAWGWAGVGVMVVGRKKVWLRACGLCAIVMALGVWRLDVAYQAPQGDDPSFFVGPGVGIVGMIEKDPEVRLKTLKLVVGVEKIEPRLTSPVQANGKTLVIASALETFEVGDRVAFLCDLEKPEAIEDFDYPRYLAKDGIFSVCNFPELVMHEKGAPGVRRALARIKRDFIQSLERVVPEPESALLAGILTGTRGRIPDTVLEDFKVAGVSHLLAISGYNIVIIAAGILGVLTLFMRRHRAFPVLSAIIIGFVVLVGGDASVVRAGIMGLTMHGLYVVDRLYRPGQILALTAAVMLIQNPRLLRDDLGFDLSFLATWGIFAVAPHLLSRMQWITNRGHVREIIAMTCAAQIATLPLLIGSFDALSLVSLPANILVVPFIPFAMALGSVAGVLGVIPLAGDAVGFIAYAVAHAMIGAIHALAQVPFATVMMPHGAFGALMGLYAVIGALWWQREKLQIWWRAWRRRVAHIPLKKTPHAIKMPSVEIAMVEVMPEDGEIQDASHETSVASSRPAKEKIARINAITIRLRALVSHNRIAAGSIAAVIGITCIFLPQYIASKKFSVWVFDVGQGDSILVSAPGGKQMLIDGGPDAKVLSKLGRAMPWWDRTIEHIVLTHPHADHVTGLVEVLKRYKVGSVYVTGVVHTTDEYLAFLQELTTHHVKMNVPKADDIIAVGEAQVKVLMPLESYQGLRIQDLNESSIVARLTYHHASFLFMGDAGNESEPALLERWGAELTSDVLKVGHHGSAYASSQEFIEAVAPQYAVISLGVRNTYGHPSPRVVKRFERAGIQVIRTDKEGDVQIVLEGDHINIKKKK